MIRANSDHKKLIISILSEAFDQNQSVNFVVKQGRNRRQRIRSLIEYSFNNCLTFGDAWISGDSQGCALILFPNRKRTSFQTISWDIRLALSTIGLGRIGTVMKREAIIKALHPKGPYCHLWFIGVDPGHQCKGVGSSMLKEIIDDCERKNLPIYLETSVDSNLLWYKKYGFEIFHTLDFGYILYLLKKEPNTVSTF